jgi:hypothetical protein
MRCWSADVLFIFVELLFHLAKGLVDPARILDVGLIIGGWQGLGIHVAGASVLAQDDRPGDAGIAVWRWVFRPSGFCAHR